MLLKTGDEKLTFDNLPVEKNFILSHLNKLESKDIFSEEDKKMLSNICYQGNIQQVLKDESTEITTPFTNKTLQNYRILKKIGEGGMGVVYKAADIYSSKEVAIKVIRSKGNSKDSTKKRFQREMELSSRLSHPYLVKMISYGEENDHPYFIMEYIQGKPLPQYIEKTEKLEEKLLIIKKVLEGLEYAHINNILHRDIKPSNIIIKEDGNPVLMDFGLAKSTEIKDKSLTQSGEILGTPQYMSPEQAKGERNKIDHQTDIYGVGAVLYHILMDKPPATGENLMEILYNVVKTSPYFSKEKCRTIPSSLQNICKKALEKKKSNRYSTAKAFRKDIENYLSHKKVIANTHFFIKKMVAISKIFTGLIAATLIIFIFSNTNMSQKSIRNQAINAYKEGKKEKNLDFAYLKFLRALELATNNKNKENKNFIYQITENLLITLFKQGTDKNNFEEALLFFYRGIELLNELSNKKYVKKLLYGERSLKTKYSYIHLK